MDQLQVNIIIEKEILTADDVVKMYGKFDGKDITVIADAFYMNLLDIRFPQLYRRLASVIGTYIGMKHGKEKYLEFLEMYNKDVLERFENKIKLLDVLYTHIYGSSYFVHILNDFPLTENDLKLNDEYSPFFSRRTRNELPKQFAREDQMESVLYENFKILNDTKVSRQINLQYGKADMILESQEEVCVVELKTGVVKRKDLYQVFDYALSYPDNFERIVSKALIGISFEDDVLRLAKELDITCIKYELDEFVKSSGLFLGLDVIQEANHSKIISELLVDYHECGCECIDHPNFSSKTLTESYIKQFAGFKKDEEKIDDLIEKGAELYNSKSDK